MRRIAVFGSVAHGDEGTDSDLDILVALERPFRKPLGLFRWVAIERELEVRLGRQVDLVSDEALSPYLRPYVDEDEVVLYEEAV